MRSGIHEHARRSRARSTAGATDGEPGEPAPHCEAQWLPALAPPHPAYAVPAWSTSPPHPVSPVKPSTVDTQHLLREASLIPTREGQVPCYHPVIYWYDSMLTPTILIDCKLHVAGPWMSGLLVAVTSSTALGTEEAQYLFVEQRNE